MLRYEEGQRPRSPHILVCEATVALKNICMCIYRRASAGQYLYIYKYSESIDPPMEED